MMAATQSAICHARRPETLYITPLSRATSQTGHLNREEYHGERRLPR